MLKKFNTRNLFLGFVLGCLGLMPLPSNAANETLKDLNGNVIPLSSLAGKWVFINYWASWCGPCVDEIAEFNRFYTRHQDTNVALFAVNYEALSLLQQRHLTQQFDIHYPSIQLKSLSALHLGAVNVVPVTYVFDPKGHLVTTLYGGQTSESLQALMKVNSKIDSHKA